MNSIQIARKKVFHQPGDEDSAQLVEEAFYKSVDIFKEKWNLEIPENLEIYIMRSWQKFLFQTAPGLWKLYIMLIFPILAVRARSIWPAAGGWALPLGNRLIVGIKPIELIQKSEKSLGENLYLPNRDVVEIIQSVTCHELMHACTFHLQLPTWLHEGIATLVMEYYLSKRIIREDNFHSLSGFNKLMNEHKREKLEVEQPQELIAAYARGYWLSRYLDETQPELMCQILSDVRTHEALLQLIAQAYHKSIEQFWQEIESDLITWFER